MAVNDNPSLVAVASSYALPSTAPPVLVQAGFSGQTDVYVAPAVLALVDGAAEGSRALTLVGTAGGQVSLPVATPADPFGTNADSAATAGGTGSISAKLRNATASLGALAGALVSGATDFVRSTISVSIASVNTAVTGFSVGAHRAIAVAIVDTGGNQLTSLAGISYPSTGTISRTATSTTNATILASNASRKGAIIFNDAATVLFVKYGTTASATSWTHKLDPQSGVEIKESYTGRIDAILASSTGNAQVTELT